MSHVDALLCPRCGSPAYAVSDEGDFICERDKADTSNPCAPDPSHPFITPLRASHLNTDELVRLRLENHRLLHAIERLTALLEKPK